MALDAVTDGQLNTEDTEITENTEN